MKKLFVIVAILATSLFQNLFAQDNSKAQLLNFYYDIKNALVAGNGNTASLKAEEFIKALKSIDNKLLAEAGRDALLSDASHIAKGKDIKHHREYFATLSTNMYTFAKLVKLTDDPVYYAYCPMIKAHWLSNQAVIKNPYYGNSMLTCGKVEETLK